MKKALLYIAGLFLGALLCLAVAEIGGSVGASEFPGLVALEVMQYAGDWNSVPCYSTQEVVRYSDGCFYLSLSDNCNIVPSANSQVWVQISCPVDNGSNKPIKPVKPIEPVKPFKPHF